MTANLYTALMGAHAASDRPAVVERDGRVWTYADLDRESGRFANRLAERGVRPGDRVVVKTEKSVATLLTYLAAARAGAVFLPLNTAYTPAEVDYFVGDAEPRLVICDPSEHAALQPIAKAKGAAIETLDAHGAGSWTAGIEAEPTAFAPVPLEEDATAVILYTSGTTGRSKGAMLTVGNLASNAATLIEYWRIAPDDRLLHALPIYHAHGLFVAVNTTLMAGARMLFHPKFDAGAVVADLPNATTMMGIPTFYTRLLARPDFGRELVGHMRLFVSGSAPLSAETHREFSARTGHAILERYGMSETGMNTSNPHDGDRVPGSVGFPLPGIEIRIADAEDRAREMPEGEVGMVEVRGPNVFKGYWRNPEKTAAELHADGFFTTGDLGFRDGRGYVFLVGREKDLIISGGLNVYPAEVEALIDELPGVAESAVIGCPHPDFGEAVTAVVVARRDAALDEAAVLSALSEKLARFKQPKRVLFVGELPRNAMGKVQKNALREKYRPLYTPEAG